MIEVEGLSFAFPRSLAPTLDSLEFVVQPNEIFGFLGPSGAGKSTTQNVLIGLLKSYTGHAKVFGRELKDWGDDYYEQIGVCFELPNHYLKLTARENLDYFRSLYQPPTHTPDEVLDWLGLLADADRRVVEYSKGMKTRLNLARALIHQPKLLFLDEPTGGLDPVNARRVKDLVHRLRSQGTTVFVTTHDMLVADQLCDRVAFIVDGKLCAIESPETLKRQHGRRSVALTYIDEAGERCERAFELDGIGHDRDFLQCLQAARNVESMHSQETTLEQVFINLTGKALIE